MEIGVIEGISSYDNFALSYLVEEHKQNSIKNMIEQIRKEVDYAPVLDICCKRVIEEYRPHPSQCNLDYFYDSQNRVDKIHVKIDETVVGVVICGKFIESDDPMKLCYTKPHELNLTTL